MSCVPGMPCYENTVVTYTTYPPGCVPATSVGSDYIIYTGTNLPCSGILNNDCLTTALQKIDTKICPAQLLDSILSVLETNPVAFARLCGLIGTCAPTNVIRVSAVNEVVSGTPYFGGLFERISGVNPDELNFSFQVDRYIESNCTGGSGSYSTNATLDADDNYNFAAITSENPIYLSGKITNLSVNSIPITTSPQTITVGSNTYIIEGFGVCAPI